MKYFIISSLLLVASINTYGITYKDTFYDLTEDYQNAKSENKQLVLYFHQEGCPYCEQLETEVFNDKDTAAFIDKHFDVIKIDIWGSNEVTDFQGKVLRENVFSRQQLQVQFTPTLILVNSNEFISDRVDGYSSALLVNKIFEQWVSNKKNNFDFSQTCKKNLFEEKTIIQKYTHHTNFVAQNDLSQLDLDNLVVTFIANNNHECENCEEYFSYSFEHPEMQKINKNLNYIFLNPCDQDRIITPEGKVTSIKNWFLKENLNYQPSFLVYKKYKGKLALQFKVKSHLRPFHLTSVFEFHLYDQVKNKNNLHFEELVNNSNDFLKYIAYKSNYYEVNQIEYQ